MSIDKLKRQRRICLAVCFLLIFMTVLLVKRFGDGMVVLFFVMMLITAIFDNHFSSRIGQLQEEWQRSQPLRTEWATVVRRRVAHGYRAGSRGVHSTWDNWCITFQTDRSGKVEMVVPRDVYLAVTEGKRGLLKHRGKQFHSFQ